MPRNVLVVEHDPHIGSMLRSILVHEGYEVELMGDRDAVLARVGEERYAAIVLEVTKQNRTGHDVLALVARDRPDVKCVVVTSSSSPASIDEIDEANVAAKLRKPFDIHELLAAVRKAVEA